MSNKSNQLTITQLEKEYGITRYYQKICRNDKGLPFLTVSNRIIYNRVQLNKWILSCIVVADIDCISSIYSNNELIY